MEYFKARTQDDLPYLVFDKVANSIEELGTLETDPLVVTFDQLNNPNDPEYISFEFGICHKRIFNNALVDRPQQDIDDQAANLDRNTYLFENSKKEKDFEYTTFGYDSKQFPLNQIARDRYQVIFDSPAGNFSIAATDGQYTLLSANIAAFKTAYYNAILGVTAPVIKSV